MRICVFGAGAVGGHFAAQLAASGHEVSVIARGAHLEAIRRNGLTLLKGEQRIVGKVQAAEDPRDIGPVDFVLVTLKATALAAFADRAAAASRQGHGGGLRAERHPVVVCAGHIRRSVPGRRDLERPGSRAAGYRARSHRNG